MSTVALCLVVLAALAHAAWNVLAKTAGGGATFVWLFSTLAAAIWLPIAVVAALVDPGRHVGAEGIAFMAGSGALHALYFVLLQRGYRDGDLSLVYPLARGTGPLLSTLAALVIFSERPSALALAGGAVIVAAVLSLAGAGRRVRTAAGDRRRAVAFALLTGIAIASYTLWDKQAVGPLGLQPVVYYWGTYVAETLLLTAFVAHRRVEIRRTWRAYRRQALGVAILSPPAHRVLGFDLAPPPLCHVAP